MGANVLKMIRPHILRRKNIRGPVEMVEKLPRGREMFKYTCGNLTTVLAWNSREISIGLEHG